MMLAEPCHPNHIPAWFLRLAAPLFYKRLTRLFNLSISASTDSQQWKSVSIRDLPKVFAPTGHSDFRPVSIILVLSRIMELTLSSTSYILHFSILHPPSPSLTSLHCVYQDPRCSYHFHTVLNYLRAHYQPLYSWHSLGFFQSLWYSSPSHLTLQTGSGGYH